MPDNKMSDKQAQDLANLTLEELFVLRFLLDKKEQVHSLEQDVNDLVYFPERMEISYRHEWLLYVKRKIRSTNIQPTGDGLKQALKQLSVEKQKRCQQQLDMIQTALAINNSDAIKVIKSPLKTYIESLIQA